MKRLSLLLLTIFLAACGPQSIQIPQSPVLKLLERKSGLIAYIGGDGNLYLTDQGANSVTPLTDDITPATQQSITYQLPTWSQAGDQLAFIRLEQKGANDLTADIYVANVDDETARSIYTSSSEFPFYLYWSPDGKSVTALTTTPARQTLALVSIPVDGGELRVLDTGNPLYWSWAPDGSTMIVHKNGGNPNVPNQLSFLKLDDEVSEFVLADSPATFQAPAWSPDGAHILLTALSDNGKQEILLTDPTGAAEKTVAEFDLNASFGWASDSRQYAYIKGTEQLQSGTLGPLHVGNVLDDKEVIIDDDVIAFFWSPDAKEVAYILPLVSEPDDQSQQVLYLRIKILDIASGESREIATFLPTDGFVSLMPYIDQYHQSVTIWSPDSNNLVVSFVDQNGVSGIAVIPSSGITEPRILVEGTSASWSWK